jgi:hypothetical protein
MNPYIILLQHKPIEAFTMVGYNLTQFTVSIDGPAFPRQMVFERELLKTNFDGIPDQLQIYDGPAHLRQMVFVKELLKTNFDGKSDQLQIHVQEFSPYMEILEI